MNPITIYYTNYTHIRHILNQIVKKTSSLVGEDID